MLKEPIAIGHTADIYSWKDKYILKLFFDWCPETWVKKEAYNTKTIYEAGLSAPAVINVVKLNDRLGILFERVEGLTMLQILKAESKKIARHAALLANLHFKIHHHAARPKLPSQRIQLQDKIKLATILPQELRRKTLHILNTLPNSNKICHGDFHPGNVMIFNQGARVIDWPNAVIGNPLADVAKTSMLLQLATIPSDSALPQNLVDEKKIRQQFLNEYLDRYFHLQAGNREQLQPWCLVTAVARLSENISELEKLQLYNLAITLLSEQL